MSVLRNRKKRIRKQSILEKKNPPSFLERHNQNPRSSFSPKRLAKLWTKVYTQHDQTHPDPPISCVLGDIPSRIRNRTTKLHITRAPTLTGPSNPLPRPRSNISRNATRRDDSVARRTACGSRLESNAIDEKLAIIPGNRATTLQGRGRGGRKKNSQYHGRRWPLSR